MPRIRTVKPQYWSTPNPPSRDARLLYVAMWNWADDDGIGTANPKELAAFAFPNDDDIGVGELRELLREIAGSFHCVFYVVGGRPYYQVENFRDHQVINKPTASKRPRPDEAEKLLYQDVYRDTGGLPESSLEGGGLEHRNTGTQEHRNNGIPPSGGPGGGQLAVIDAEVVPVPAVATPAERRATRIPEHWEPTQRVKDDLIRRYPNLKLGLILEEFRNYWESVSGAKSRRTDWDKTFRNRVAEMADKPRFQRAEPRPGADKKINGWDEIQKGMTSGND